jgi:hypothetical protein
MAGVWFLGLTKDRAAAAGIGRACVQTRLIMRRQLWFRVALFGSGAVLVFIVAALVAALAGLVDLPYMGPFGHVLILVLVLVLSVAGVESAPDVPHLWRTRHASDRAAAAVRAAGHTGTIAFVSGLVSEDTRDVIQLGRRWLRHVDEHGIALVTVARTERLARAYTVQGFQPLDVGGPLLLMRLPRSR